MKINVPLIETYIRKNKLSKTAFCKKCKISYLTLQKIYSDNFNGNILVLFKIARVLKVGIKDLFV